MQKVSIVTISFNQADYLEEAILSVIQQDYPSIEYIVVDPGSTDGSRGIIERYRNRLSKVIYDQDRGPADGLNHGFEVASGAIFAYLNADDVLLPGAVSSAVRALNQSTIAVVYGDGYLTDEKSNVQKRCFSTKFSARRFALGTAIIMQQSSFWRSEWHHKMGGFNVENRTCWDAEFFFRIALAGGTFCHVSQYWSCFRIHSQSITGSRRATQEFLAYVDKMLRPHLSRRGFMRLSQRAARLMKYVENPRIVLWRIDERLFGPPNLKSAH